MAQATPACPTVQDLERELRDVILSELASDGLDEPEALASALGLEPIKVVSLLRRKKWSIETSMAMIEQLNLPIGLQVMTTR